MTFRELSNLNYEKFMRRHKMTIKESKNKCCICHKNLSKDENYSALPLKEGSCCKTCYREVVSPIIMCGKTIEELKNGGFTKQEIKESTEPATEYDKIFEDAPESMFDDENEDKVVINKAPSIEQTKVQDPTSQEIDYANEVDPDFIGKEDNDYKITNAINDSFFNEDGSLNGNKIL